MKSIFLQQSYIKDPENYGDLEVLKSNAGYYIGSIYTDPSGFQEPGTRDSQYFPTYDAAYQCLLLGTWIQRECP